MTSESADCLVEDSDIHRVVVGRLMFEVDRDFEVLREAWGTDPPDEVLAVFLAFDDHHRSQHGELDGLAKIGEDVAEKPPGEPELTEDLAKEQIVWSHRASPGHLTCVERHVAEI